MKTYILSVDTMFSVQANSEEEALEKALEHMPLSDLEFIVMEEYDGELAD